jgi:hypothetical protein
MLKEGGELPAVMGPGLYLSTSHLQSSKNYSLNFIVTNKRATTGLTDWDLLA